MTAKRTHFDTTVWQLGFYSGAGFPNRADTMMLLSGECFTPMYNTPASARNTANGRMKRFKWPRWRRREPAGSRRRAAWRGNAGRWRPVRHPAP